MGLINTLQAILNHPLNQSHKSAALKRYVRWQLGSRILSGEAVMPFVDRTSLVVSTGMTGATMYIYTGLADFPDCSFLLHTLASSDLFVDCGANVGVYTVLAAGVRGAHAVTIEPVPATFHKMQRNMFNNAIHPLVEMHNVGFGRDAATLQFSSDGDTTNHVITDQSWTGPSIQVPVHRLDGLLGGKNPTLIKIDVEGWESEVLAGSEETLKKPSLLGLIIEMDGTRATFNPSERIVHDTMTRHGFLPYAYAPFTRALTPLPSKNVGHTNTLYLRNLDEIKRRIAAAPAFHIHGRQI